MEEKVMISLLDRFISYADGNRLVEAKRLAEQEINNVKGITEQKCKKRKLLINACSHCTNANCNLNTTQVEMNNEDVIRVLEDLKDITKENDTKKVSEQIENYLLIIKDQKVIEILKAVKGFADREMLLETRDYILLELGNFTGTTPVECKKHNKYHKDWYCSYCSIYNCPDNKKTEK